MRAVIVGEAWGAREAKFQHALVGPTGRELTLMAGFANLMPHMEILCRKCKYNSRYINPRCEFCGELLWPTEHTLIEHWKKMRLGHEIHVTNVFNTKPPDVCSECDSINVAALGNYRYKCRDCGSNRVKTNEIGYFFGTERQTPMASYKASQSYGGSHLKREYLYHIKRLYKEIQELDPNLIIALGNVALWALSNESPKIGNIRGTITMTNMEEL